MEVSEFLNTARSKISKDPRSRLSKLAKSAIDNPDCVIDVHAHIFDKKCLTVGYILLRLLKSKILESIGLESFAENSLLAKEEDEIYKVIESKKFDNKDDWQQLENELENISEITESIEIFGFDLKEAFTVLKKNSMLEVLDYYINKFSLIQLPEFAHRSLVTGVLMMDLETGWGIKPQKKLFQQINEIKQVMLSKTIIPFLPLDPRRANFTNSNENLYDLFLKAFVDHEPSFFGVKCYPALGYLPNDFRLDPIFQICAEKNIPVFTHCGGEIVSTFSKEIEFQDSTGTIEFKIPGNSRIERARYLNNPELWIPVLDKYNNLKLSFGHFGGDSNWENYNLTGKNERISKIIEMMKNPNYIVFADFSFNVVEKELYDAFEKELNNDPEIAEKVMFGTDYWVVLPAGDLLGMQQVFLTQLKNHRNTLLQTAPLRYLLA
jgi:hypothetical protein